MKCQAQTPACAPLRSTVRWHLHMTDSSLTGIPLELDTAKVLKTAKVAEHALTRTGDTIHYVEDGRTSSISNLAIAQYPEEAGFYLFQCDQRWNVITDTWHESVEAAETQAEFEYAGVSTIWNTGNAT